MTSVTEIGQAIRSVLSVVGDKVARATGFTKRKSKLTGAKFAQTTVLGWLSQPEATLDELSRARYGRRSRDQPSGARPALHPRGGSSLGAGA